MHFRIVEDEKTGGPTLELVTLSGASSASSDEVRTRVLGWLEASPGPHSTTAVRKGVEGDDKTIDKALADLLGEPGKIRLKVGKHGLWQTEPSTDLSNVGEGESTGVHRRGVAKYWQACIHAQQASVLPLPPTFTDEVGAPPEEAKVGESVRTLRGRPITTDLSAEGRVSSTDADPVPLPPAQPETPERQAAPLPAAHGREGTS